jgi:hypothetical protein
MVSRAWCFGFGSGWGRQTCFSLAVRRSKRWYRSSPIGNPPYRLRGLGTIWVWDHAMIIGVQGDFLIFNFNTNIHSNVRLDFDLLRLVQFPYARKNLLCAPARHDTILANKRNSITHCFDNETELPGHRSMIPPSIQLATSSHLLRAPSEALQVAIICQISVLFQELISETASRPKNLKTQKNPGEVSLQWQGSMMPSICT